MRRWRRSALSCGAGIAMLVAPAVLSAATCDEYDPTLPPSGTRITLDSSDFSDQNGDEMRSFIDTGSVGKVAVAVVSTTPPGIVRGVSATPEVSRMLPGYGERLKGIAVTVTLRPGPRAVQVVLDLRQVCARYFRNTFLYR